MFWSWNLWNLEGWCTLTIKYIYIKATPNNIEEPNLQVVHIVLRLEVTFRVQRVYFGVRKLE